ncbi:MAG: GtrA family protein, partial [Actinomycetota bacterium]
MQLTTRFLGRVLGTRLHSRLDRLIGFGLVGMSGLLVNQLALFTITEGAGVHYVLSAIVASQFSTLWNFALTETLVFRSRSFPGRLRRVLLFSAMNNLWLVGRLPLLYVLTDGMGLHYLMSNLIALGSSTLIRFFISDRWIWRQPRPGSSAREPTQATCLYNIQGILRISSVVRLPELEPFRRPLLDGPVDLEVVHGKSLGKGTSV